MEYRRPTTEVKALAILQNMEGKTINELRVDNLNTLLGWHGVAIGTLKNKGEKVARWEQIMASMKQPLSFARWTDEDRVQLLSVMSDDINIMDTQYGHLVALQERELEATLEGMTQVKRDALRKRLDKMSTDSG
jgi:hypothetical protein